MKKLLLGALALAAFMYEANAQTATKIGDSRYDLQTNGSVARRVVNHGGGAVSAVWTYSPENGGGYPNRGTGYNYTADGSTWENDPADFVQNQNYVVPESGTRVGWPNNVVTESGREVILTHKSSGGTGGQDNGLFMVWRDNPGAQWQSKTVPGTLDADTWPRVAASGNTIVAIIGRQAGGTPQEFNGVTGGIAVYRSEDAGDTWEGPLVMDGMTPNNFSVITPDDYSISSNGSTFAVVCDQATGSFFKSNDFGRTWTLNKMMPGIPYGYVDGSDDLQIEETPVGSDGAFTSVIDNNGILHVSFGRVAYFDRNLGNVDGGNLGRNPHALAYWNETMAEPVLITNTMIKPADGVETELDFANNASLTATYGAQGNQRPYGQQTVSMPSIGVDGSGSVYISYSSIDEGRLEPSTGGYLRSVYIVKSDNGGDSWVGPYNVGSLTGFTATDELVYASMAEVVDNDVHLIVHRDGSPGTIVQETQIANTAPNSIQDVFYVKVPTTAIVDDLDGANERPVITDRYEPVIFTDDNGILELPTGCPIEDALTKLYPIYDRQESLINNYTILSVGTPFNNSAVGDYEINFFGTDNDANVSDTMPINSALFNPGAITGLRVSVVADNEDPVIALNGLDEVCIPLNGSFVDPGATVNDNSPCIDVTDITVNDGGFNPNSAGSYTFTYSVTDEAGNSTSVTRTVNVIENDNEAPVVTLIGSADTTIEACDNWISPGALGEDCLDGIITDFNAEGLTEEQEKTVGSYDLTYTVTDAAGNPGTAVRTVNVVDTEEPDITINGSDTTINSGGTYTELGATAEDCVDGIITDIVIDNASVNTDTTQTTVFFVNYTATDAAGNVATTRRRVVVDASLIDNIRKTDLSKAINAYPNPTTGIVSIELPSNNDFSSIRVISITGETVEANASIDNISSASIDLTGQAAGLYIIELVGETTVATRKVTLK